MSTKHVMIVGMGNMGGALTKGLLSSSLDIRLHCVDKRPEMLEPFAEKGGGGGAATSATSGAGAGAGAGDCSQYVDISDCGTSMDAVFLCVKPQDLVRVADALTPVISANTLVLSILAGTTLRHLGEALGTQQPLVRAMPNIAALVSESPTVACCNDVCHDEQRALATSLMLPLGKVYWTTEDKLDAVTGLSGSGPAYIYMVIESLTDGGVKMGLPRALALNLAIQTAIGAGKLVQDSGAHPAILRDKVTTPGGTTIDAIHELESKGLRAMLINAVAVATEKSRLLNSKS